MSKIIWTCDSQQTWFEPRPGMRVYCSREHFAACWTTDAGETPWDRYREWWIVDEAEHEDSEWSCGIDPRGG